MFFLFNTTRRIENNEKHAFIPFEIVGPWPIKDPYRQRWNFVPGSQEEGIRPIKKQE